MMTMRAGKTMPTVSNVPHEELIVSYRPPTSSEPQSGGADTP